MSIFTALLQFPHLARAVEIYSLCIFLYRLAFKIFSDCHFKLQSFVVNSSILNQLVNKYSEEEPFASPLESLFIRALTPIVPFLCWGDRHTLGNHK